MQGPPRVQRAQVGVAFDLTAMLEELLSIHEAFRFTASHLVKLYFSEMRVCWQPGNLNVALRWVSATCPLFCSLVQMDSMAWLTAAPWGSPKAPRCAVWNLGLGTAWGQTLVPWRGLSPSSPWAAQTSNRCLHLPRRLLFAAIARQVSLVFVLEPGVPKPSQTRSLLLLP